MSKGGRGEREKGGEKSKGEKGERGDSLPDLGEGVMEDGEVVAS